jgi:hypothetical protein
MPTYAGIGARATPIDVINVMKQTAALLAKDGYTCNTGAALGADQAFATGALAGFGKLQLFLPWSTYEKNWIKNLQGDISTYVFDTGAHRNALSSVYKYHPKANNLKNSVIALHARNYLIVSGVQFVICWTPNGKVTGGTGQALRIVQDTGGIRIFNLGDPATLLAFQKKIKERADAIYCNLAEAEAKRESSLRSQ